MTETAPPREDDVVAPPPDMTATPDDLLSLLQSIDTAPPGDEDWSTRLARVDDAMTELTTLAGSTFHREDLQDSECFVQFTKSTTSSVILQFSEWGDLVCITHRPTSGGATGAAQETDLAFMAECPEVLRRHGFVPVLREHLMSPYTGNVYGDDWHAANNDPSYYDWYWRFFDWH